VANTIEPSSVGKDAMSASSSNSLGPNGGLSATHFSFPASATQPGRPFTAAAPLSSQITPAAGDMTSLNTIMAEATSVLANIDGLTGNLLSTVIAQVASLISLAEAATPLPTTNLAGQGFIPSVVSGAGQTINAATIAAGGIVQPVTTPVQAAAGAVLAGNGLLRGIAEDSSTNDVAMPVITEIVNPIPAEQNNVAAVLSVFNEVKNKRRMV
jgi:hypothetical protein